jgi:hypothetical protein
MWPFIIVKMKPLIQIPLKLLYGTIELVSECLPKELVQDGSVKSFDESIGPRPGHFRSPMLYIIELQKDLIRVNHRSAAIFSAVIREDVLNVKVMGFIEGHHPVIKNIHGSFWKFGGIELTKSKGSVSIHHSLKINTAYAL